MPATRITNSWPIARTASTDVWAAMLEKFCTVRNTGLRRLNIRMRSNRMMPGPSLMSVRAHLSDLSEFRIDRGPVIRPSMELMPPSRPYGENRKILLFMIAVRPSTSLVA
jgi:hypothetical protein